MRIFDYQKTVNINNRILVIQRSGLGHFMKLFAASESQKPEDTIRAIQPFLLSPIKGSWALADLKLLANEIIEHNSPPKPKKKKKTEEEAEDNKQMTLEEMAEFLLFRVAEITGWTLQHIAECVSFYEAVQLLKYKTKSAEDENIRWMINIAYGYSGKVQEYAKSLKFREENLDTWAQDNGYQDYEDFERAEKERWASVLKEEKK